MRCSPNSAWLKALICSGFVLAAGSVAAQQAAPQATGAPRSILPNISQETAPTADMATEGVEAAALTDGPVILGPLGPNNGGFGPDLWRGTPSTTVAALMARLPVADGSTAAHDLARRLLLSAASVQADVRSGPAVSAADRRLMGIRLEKLAERGDLENAVALATLAGDGARGASEAQLKADVFLLGDDYERACAVAQTQIESTATPPWLEVLAFCRALRGDGEGTALTVELLRENNATPPEFYHLLDNIASPDAQQKVVLDTLKPLSPLLLTMGLATGAQLPADIVAGASPLMLARLATAPALPARDRLAAAWAVARRGGLEPARLRQLYAALPYSAQERRAAAVVAPSLPDAEAVALFVQALATAPDPAEQARLVQAAARHGRDTGTLPMLAALTVDQLAALPITGETLAAAPDVARLLLLAGDTESARRWYDAVRGAAAAGDLAASGAVVDLWPLLLIAAGNPDSSHDLPQELVMTPEVLNLWWQHQQPLPEAARARRAAVLLTLAEAMGLTPPQDAWAWFGDAPDAMAGAMPSDDMWPEFTDATAQGRVGEMVLTTLVVMGSDGPRGVSPVFLAAAVRGLMAVGLQNDARRLAAEAMIAQGF